MPQGATFSQGRPYGASEWNLTPDEIGDLRLRLPKTATGSSDLRVELMAADGTILASASTRIDIAPDPKAALILRADESNRVEDLIAHGQKMIDVGYFAGARAYFRRAAEAGSGEAALMLAATYDQEYIDKIGAHGIKADPNEARIWYERAKQLGVEGAEEKLAALKAAWADHRAAPIPAPEPAADDASDLVEAGPEAEAEPTEASDVSVSGIGVVPTPSESEPSLPADKDEWVALVGYANVRVRPLLQCGHAQGGGEGRQTPRDRPQGQLGAGHRSHHGRGRLGLCPLYRGGAGAVGETISPRVSGCPALRPGMTRTKWSAAAQLVRTRQAR